MCLGMPGRVLSVEPNPLGMTMGAVDFDGDVQHICLAYVPDVQVGDFVLANIGFATARLSAEEAQEVRTFLCDLDDAIGADSAGALMPEAATLSIGGAPLLTNGANGSH